MQKIETSPNQNEELVKMLEFQSHKCNSADLTQSNPFKTQTLVSYSLCNGSLPFFSADP